MGAWRGRAQHPSRAVHERSAPTQVQARPSPQNAGLDLGKGFGSSFPLYGPKGSADSLRLGLGSSSQSSAQALAGEPFASVLAKAEGSSNAPKETESAKTAKNPDETASKQGKVASNQAESPKDGDKALAAKSTADKAVPPQGDEKLQNKGQENKKASDLNERKAARALASTRGSPAPKTENPKDAGLCAKSQKKVPAEVSKEKESQSALSSKRPAAQLAHGKAEKAEDKDGAAGREETKLKDKNKGEKLAAGQMNQNAALALSQAKQPELAKGKTQSRIASEAGDVGSATDKNKKKSEGPEIKLTDLRGKDEAKQRIAIQAKLPDAVQASGDKGASKESGGQKAELNLDLSNSFVLRPGTSGSEGAEKTLGSAPSPHSFSETLAERLKNNWNNELVQSAHIVLKDGDAGTIRLHLKPESLGGVKIELKLADNCISGKIVVESDEAKSAFERNMASLNDAFKAGGFESAKLEVSVGSGRDNRGGQQGDAPEPFWSERRRLESFDRAVPETQSYAAAGRLPGAVDILA